MKQNSAKLSVVIPIYNVELYLRQCLDSIVNQTYRNLEIILVDDGSSDNCGAICDECAQKDDRIVVIHKHNGGVSAARNDGIELATGEWVTFVDPDDWCDVDFYERLFDAMRDQDIDIFCSGGCFNEFCDTKMECRIFTDYALFEGRAQTDFLMAKTLAAISEHPAHSKVKGALSVCWDKLYKRSFLLKNQLRFDATLHPTEDILFNFIAFDKVACVAACSCIGYHYRLGVATAATKRFNPRMPDICVSFINSLNDYMRHREPNKLVQETIDIKPVTMFFLSAKCYYFHKDNPNTYKITAAEVKKMKLEPTFYAAIHSNNNQYLSKKQLVLKYLLRLPWVWPIKLACSARQMMPK